MMFTIQQYTEVFHLLFLRHLENKLPKHLYALKGGCNLRFFFKSIRYSEDIDLDIKTVAKDTLRTQITKLLKSSLFSQTLHSKGIEISHLSFAKQTDTTQRWKLQLRVSGHTAYLPTKIEFSRRNMEGKTLFESIDTELIRTYQLYPILVNHYAIETAFFQKIEALIHRTETQARDIFDLKLLLDQGDKPRSLPQKLKIKIDQAIENITTVNFAGFKGQVVAYLLVDYQNHYRSPKVWNEIQNAVVHMLKEFKNEVD